MVQLHLLQRLAHVPQQPETATLRYVSKGKEEQKENINTIIPGSRSDLPEKLRLYEKTKGEI